MNPGDVLVAGEAEDEPAYVCDFGVARHVSSVGSLTGDRGFVGTVDYVPPEQIQGERIDGRADVYSLACVLYECLAGAPVCYFSYSARPTGTRRPHVPKGHLALARDSLKAPAIDERLITREEVVALLFNVSDIARLLERIQALLRGDDGEEDESRD